MQDSPAAVCSCGDQTPDILDHSTSCSKSRQRRSRGKTPVQSAENMTPPPSQPGSPQHTSPRITTVSDVRKSRRPSEVIQVIQQAFANGDSEDDEPGSSTLLPQSCYRTPARTASDSSSPGRKSSASSVPPSGRMPTMPRGSDESVRTSGSATPEIRPFSPGYSPMAAGFARLSLDGNRPSEQTRARSTRPSFALEAKMFSGPA